MRALLVLVLAAAGCIDLDAFSEHYDAGASADLSTHDLTGVDLAGEPCNLMNPRTVALTSPPSWVPSVASIGHDATGTYFLLGVINATSQVEVLRHRLEDGTTTSLGVLPCGSDCRSVRIARAFATDPSTQVAMYTDHTGQRWNVPTPPSNPSPQGAVDCTPASTFGGDVISLGSHIAFSTNCLGTPLDFIDERQVHHPLPTWTSVLELRLARSSDGMGALVERDSVGTSIYRFDIAGATPGPMRLSSSTTVNGLGLDMVDDGHVLAAGVPNSPSTLHLFVLSPAVGMLEIDTGFQAANNPSLPVSVAAAADGYLLVYHDVNLGPFGRFVDLDGQTRERFSIGGSSTQAAQVAGDPTALSHGPHGALLAAWLTSSGGTLSLVAAQVECP
jgi:hypothetical protein